MRNVEYAWCLLLGILFGVLLGSAMDEDTRSWTIRVLVLFVTGAVIAVVTTSKRRE